MRRILIAAVTSLCVMMLAVLHGGIGEAVIIDPEAVPLGNAAFVPSAVASGINVQKNSIAEIDYSNAADGYIMARSLDKTGKELRTIIKTPGGRQYTYILSRSGKYDILPLSEGNGNYHASVYENVKGTKFSTIMGVSFQVKLNDEFAPFLRPNQYANYTASSETVKKAADITSNADGVLDKVSAVYRYVTANITYDKELAKTVKSGYLTDVDAVLKKGKGICFDYAAVMTAMLRSQQIPSKLVIGYSGGAYHAWINVYSPEKGWVERAIYFDGASWALMDPTFAANKSAKELSGTAYTAKLTY